VPQTHIYAKSTACAVRSEEGEEVMSENNIKQINMVFAEYQHTINKIDDYFEYSYKSQDDREFVLNAIDLMTRKIEKICKNPCP